MPRRTSHKASTFSVAPAEADPNILALQGFCLGGIRQLIGPVPNASLIHNSDSLLQLIDSILLLAKAQVENSKISSSDAERPSRPYSGHEEIFTIDLEAVRVRDYEKAHEILRQTIFRRLGVDEAATHANQTGPEEHLHGTERSTPPSYCLEHEVAMTAIEVLSSGCWRVQHGINESVAIKALQDLRAHIQRYKTVSPVLTDAYNIQAMISACSNHRCFFMMQMGGNIGGGPKIMEAGDQVAVFVGAKYPYILRPTVPFDGRYQLVGMAIIPVIMHGEIFEMNLQEKEFLIC